MLNAIEPGSPLPIHRHRKSSETVVCLRGRLVEEFYDELKRRCWFDDFYPPEYTVLHFWEAFIPHIHSGTLVGEPQAERNLALSQ